MNSPIKRVSRKAAALLLALCIALSLGATAFAAEPSAEAFAATGAAAKLHIAMVYGGTVDETNKTATGVPVSHSFVEIYNPNDFDVNLAGYSLFYQGFPTQQLSRRNGWARLDLSSVTLPAKTSYLVNCGATADGRTVVLSDFDQTWTDGPSFVTKGAKYVLTIGVTSIDGGIVNPFDTDGSGTQIDGYIDMFGGAGNDSNKTDGQDGFETAYHSYNNGSSKQKGYVRIDRNVDTDNNRDDFTPVDFRESSAALPRSMADGPLGGSVTPEPTATVKNIALNIGATETQRNLTWYSDSVNAGEVQLAPASAVTGGTFPTVHTAFAATRANSNVTGFGVYKAALDNLAPDTEYAYRVGNADGWSDIYTFTTGGTGAFSFFVAGDPQIGSSGNAGNDTAGWTTTLNNITTWFPNVDFMISVGDQVETATKENEYDGFLAPDALRSLTLAVNVGNHDSGSAIYKEHFTSPNAATLSGDTAAGGNYWYSYNGVLFMSINSNNRSTAQHKAFLLDAIASFKAQNGGNDPLWKIVTFHHAIYSSASHTTDSDIRERRQELSPVFAELGIDAVLAGHDHVYTRAYIMDGLTPITDGYTELGGDAYGSYAKVPGAAGETFYLEANSASGSKFYAIKQTDFPFVAAQNQENRPNITKVDVSADALTFTTYRTGAGNTAADVVDTFTLSREGAPVSDTAVKVNLRAKQAQYTLDETPEFTVSLENVTSGVNQVALTFEADGNLLTNTALEPLNGFVKINAENWTDLGEGKWQCDVTLLILGGQLDAGADILRVTFDTVGTTGTASVKLTGVTVAGVNSGGQYGDFESEIANAEAVVEITETPVVYSKYDLNKDGGVDYLDLGILAFYVQRNSADDDWTTYCRVTDVNGEPVYAFMCDVETVESDGEINMCDLLDLLLNYTR